MADTYFVMGFQSMSTLWVPYELSPKLCVLSENKENLLLAATLSLRESFYSRHPS